MKKMEHRLQHPNMFRLSSALGVATFNRKIMSESTMMRIMDGTRDFTLQQVEVFAGHLAEIIEQSTTEEEILTKKEALLQKLDTH